MERPFPAYEGTEPFIFVCYAHDDAALVYPELTRLRGAGFHIWYDEGISPGSEWSEALAEHIQRCTVLLFFVTPQSVEREHCRREVNFALEERCTILPVHLEPTDVPAALKLSLSHRQAILRHEHAKKAYEQKLDRALEAAALGRSEIVETPGLLQIGDWQLDVGNHCLIRDDERRTLEPKDLSVLLHLSEAAPDLVPTEDLLERSWPGMVVGDNALHQVIGRLRRALGDAARNPSYIETVPRRGYRLLAQTGDVKPAAPPRETSIEAAPSTHRAQRSVVWRGGLAATLLAAIFALVLVWSIGAFDGEGGEITIAVLPFASLDRDPEHEEFANGVTEHMRVGFRRLDGVQLIGRISSNHYAEGNRDAREIARELNADYIVEGTVLRTADRVRISFSLIDGQDGTSTLDLEYDQKFADAASLFEIYDDIAVEAGGVLEAFVTGYEFPTTSLNAENLLYRTYALKRSSEEIRERVDLLEQAVALDPQSALLRGFLASNLVELAQFRPDTAAVVDRARDEALKALATDSDEPWATMALAQSYVMQNVAASESLEALKKAESAGADPDMVANYTSVVLLNAGRYEAAEQITRRAFTLDGKNPSVSQELARSLFLQGRISEAWQYFDNALELEPSHLDAVNFALACAAHVNDANRYRDVLEKIPIDAIPDWAEPLARTLEGDRSALLAKLEEYEQLRADGVYVPPYLFTHMYWYVGDYDGHIRWYAIAEEEANMLFLVNMFLAMKPNYWQKLEAWAADDPAQFAHRQQLLDEHRTRIARITDQSVLSDEEVERALLDRTAAFDWVPVITSVLFVVGLILALWVWRRPTAYLREAFGSAD